MSFLFSKNMSNRNFAELVIITFGCGVGELRYVVDCWRIDYNHYRPHSSLDYMAPAAFAATCLEQGSAPLRLAQDKQSECEILS